MKRKFAIRAFLRSELDDPNQRLSDLPLPEAKSLTPVLYLEPPAVGSNQRAFTPRNAASHRPRASPIRPAPSSQSACLPFSAKPPAPPGSPRGIPQTFFLPKIGRASCRER